MSYDLIGDIHGHATMLATLLERLGYSADHGVYSHPDRQVIFLGDFIDRGPEQRRVIDIVRPMIEAGTALAVMGNHEFNAIAWHTTNLETGAPLREHTIERRRQHEAFLAAYEHTPNDHADVIQWFKTLPLSLDLGGCRVVHACWDPQWISRIREAQSGNNCLSPSLLQRACVSGTWEYQAIETLLKGKELPLGAGKSFLDKDGIERHGVRVRWWDRQATTLRDAFIGPEYLRTHIPDDDVNGDHLIDYAHSDVPVFLGHYWLAGEPAPLAPNIACLDYSVVSPAGKLVAYRWDGERLLSREKFVWVERDSRAGLWMSP